MSTNRRIDLFLDNYTTSISTQSIYTDIDYNFEVNTGNVIFFYL